MTSWISFWNSSILTLSLGNAKRLNWIVFLSWGRWIRHWRLICQMKCTLGVVSLRESWIMALCRALIFHPILSYDSALLCCIGVIRNLSTKIYGKGEIKCRRRSTHGIRIGNDTWVSRLKKLLSYLIWFIWDEQNFVISQLKALLFWIDYHTNSILSDQSKISLDDLFSRWIRDFAMNCRLLEKIDEW